MSYTIVYNKFFLKSSNGYTFVVLHGDNNVWETNKKRARDWNIWDLNLTAEEMTRKYESFTESDELFQYNGKWYGNKDLNRMIERGIKSAISIEEFLAATGLTRLRSRLNVICNDVPYGHSGHSVWECEKDIQTTEQFDEWLKEIAERKDCRYCNESLYPEFSLFEDLKIKTVASLPGRVIAKQGKMYVSEIKDGHWYSSSSDIKNAMIFDSLEDARAILHHNRDITFIDADNALKRNEEANYYIAFHKDGKFVGFVTKVTKSGFKYAYKMDYAHKYTKGAGNQQIKKLTPRFENQNGSFVLVNAEDAK